MVKFVVGIDTDGVLIDTNNFYLEEGKRFFKQEPINPDAYSFEKMFSISKLQKILFGIKVLDKYCKKAPLRDGAVRAINAMREDSTETHAITARMFTTHRDVLGVHYRKLYNNYLQTNGLKFDSIQFCSDTYGPRDKYMACLKLDVDVMIEDNPDIAYYLAEQGIKVLLFKAPYNKDVRHKNIIPVNNWNEVYDMYKELRNEKEKHKIVLHSTKTHVQNLNVNKEVLRQHERRFKLVYYATFVPFSILFKSKIKGKENIPYQNGFVIVSNHLDNYEQFYINRALGNRQLCSCVDSTIRHTIRGRVLNFTDSAIFINQIDRTNKKSIENELVDKMANDKIVLAVPEEPKTSKDEKSMKQLQLKCQLGMVSLAQKMGVAILPVSLYRGKHTYLKIGELQFVQKMDNLIIANKKLADTISSMTMESINEDKAKQKRK